MTVPATNRLPPGWVSAPLETLFAVLEDGRTLHQGWSPQCESVPSATNDEWGVLKTTAIQAGAFHPEHNKRLPPALTPRPLLAVRAGDIVITAAGPRARCGVSCLVRGTRPRLMLSGKMYRFRVPDEHTEPRYVEAYLQSAAARHAIDRMKTGGSDSGLNLTHDRFRVLDVLVAPLQEQRRIVESLEELLSDVDAGVAALERVREKLKLYRASVLKAAVEGALTAEWRAQHPDVEPASELLARILTERRRRWEEDQLAKFKAKVQEPPKHWKAKHAGLMGPTPDLPGLPQGWCWASVDQLGEVGTGATPNRGMRVRYYDGGTIPWVTSSCANDAFVHEPSERVTPAALDQCNLTLYPPGTLLLAMYGEGRTRGRCTELAIESTTNQALAAILVSAEVRPFLKLFLANNYDDIRNTASGGVQPNLNLSLVRDIGVPLPPVAEQHVIVETVQGLLSVVDHLEADLEAKMDSAQALRQAILRHAFAGKLVPQDPDDEPASELLKRIAAQREARAREDDTARNRGKPSKRRARIAKSA